MHLVDQTETIQAQQQLSHLLTQIKRNDEHIQQVGQHGETKLPVVKVRSKRWLRENELVKEAQKKAQTKSQASGKELELTWGIERNNDLEHRLRKMEVWLADGKNVEILLGQKRGGRKASQEEAEELVEIVREKALAVQGAHEAAPVSGTVGGQAVLKFSGREEQKAGLSTAAAMKKERQEKMKRKEEEKERKRADAEGKKRRAMARGEEKMEHLRARAGGG